MLASSWLIKQLTQAMMHADLGSLKTTQLYGGRTNLILSCSACWDRSHNCLQLCIIGTSYLIIVSNVMTWQLLWVN